MPKFDQMTKNNVFFMFRSHSKMSKNDETPNFNKMAKNNVFIHVTKPPVSFPKPPVIKNA